MPSRHFTGHGLPSLPVCRSATGVESFRPIDVNDDYHQGPFRGVWWMLIQPIEAIRANLPITPKIFSIELTVLGVVLGPSSQTAR
jgi:hypothetical protein